MRSAWGAFKSLQFERHQFEVECGISFLIARSFSHVRAFQSAQSIDSTRIYDKLAEVQIAVDSWLREPFFLCF